MHGIDLLVGMWHVQGKLTDGTVFDSSVTKGRPFSFNIGMQQVRALACCDAVPFLGNNAPGLPSPPC